jgi:hypothetical protein
MAPMTECPQRGLAAHAEMPTGEAQPQDELQPPRVVAIDWSGSLNPTYQRRKIWLAEARGAQLMRLESGRTREELVPVLLDELRREPRTIVGLDFAFSLPAWFLAELGLSEAHELWALLADTDIDPWLRAHEPPFWGRRGSRRPTLVAEFRGAERRVESVRGIRPKSVFQVYVPGAVGTGSLWGMPLLHRLAVEGCSIWPFDEPAYPQILEIYPRLLTGPVNKTSATARQAYLDHTYPDLGATLRACRMPIGSAYDAAVASDDAFDAAISALRMARGLAGPVPIPPDLPDEERQVEGAIWQPTR